MTIDPTINAGSVISALIFLVGIGGALWRHAVTSAKAFDKIDDLHVAIGKQQDGLSHIRDDFHQLQLAFQEMKVIQQRMADGKEEMGRLEYEITRLRDWRHNVMEPFMRSVPKVG